MSLKKSIAVLGAGSWGTALSVLLSANGHEVFLWEFFEERIDQIVSTRENPDFLPGVKIPEEIIISSDLEECIVNRDMILLTVPSHVVRSVCERFPEDLKGNPLLVSGCKGIENETLLRVSEIIKDTQPNISDQRIVILSGPSHAEEVGRRVPTAVTAASVSREAANIVQNIFMNPSFRIYTNKDVVGVELGGSLKNVIAIASGISDGVGFGDNTKAALLNRGIVEITRLGTAMGADRITFAGLSGMGDLIVTCTSRHSRNRYLGEQIGKGKNLNEVKNEMVQVVEGVRTTRSVFDLAKKFKVEMPISNEVYKVLFEEKNPKDAVYDLMTRNPKSEDWG